MKKLCLFILFCGMIQSTLIACDACGCSIAGGGVGLYANYRNNFITLGYQWSAFHAAGQDAHSMDDFHIVEVSSRFYFTDRLKVDAFLPYRINVRHDHGDKLSLNGLGDARLLIGYTVLKDKLLGENWGVFSEVNAGVKLPTGKYDPSLHDKDLPENFNLGTGGMGYMLQSNTMFYRERDGFIVAFSALVQGKSSDDYDYGDQYTVQTSYYREVPLSPGLKLIPNAGLAIEWITGDQYANGQEVSGTGGHGGFVNAGFTFKAEKWMAGATYAVPLWDTYSDGEVDAKNRFSVQVSYLF